MPNIDGRAITYVKGRGGREFCPSFSNVSPEAMPIRTTRNGRKPTETCRTTFG